MSDQANAALRSLPSVTHVLDDERVKRAGRSLLPVVVTGVARRAQDAARRRIQCGELAAADEVVDAVVAELCILAGERSSRVVNGTGVIVQTNLGRAPVSDETAAAIATAAANYLALETDLYSGERGGRGSEVDALMRALTGAERTLVVNNNASAVLLTLAATCAGRRVLVSRGEAVEIGGGFRIPDVLRQSGAELVEVGTTNRTYIRDYDLAIQEETAAVLRVHASNFAIVGFVARPELGELAALARSRGLLALEDVGSGCLLDTAAFGLSHEPTLSESIRVGVDVVCASGDKLLGGPQAGLILGRKDIVDRISRHPLARAVRADKTALAGIAATLRHYARGDAIERIPVWWSISRDAEWLKQRASAWLDAIDGRGQVITSDAVVGGGSLPGMTLPSFALALDATDGDASGLATRLRTGQPAIVPHVADGKVLVDARTVLPDQDDELVAAVRRAIALD
jgi:L-seryl-tRNA(Ser) seleniumtransferase